MDNLTSTEENYLKIIYINQIEKKVDLTTNLLAALTQTKPASVTEMIKKLSKKNYLNYKPYKGVELSEDGKKIAMHVLRKHRLWEAYLVRELKYGWDEIEEIADELEHIDSESLINKIDRIMNYPKFGPYGDPIPNTQGFLTPRTDMLLIDTKPNDKCRVSGVKIRDTKFLQKLSKLNLIPGIEIKIKSKDVYDDSVNIEVANAKIKIDKEISYNLYVNKNNSFLKLF